jgi:hypothetical protein
VIRYWIIALRWPPSEKSLTSSTDTLASAGASGSTSLRTRSMISFWVRERATGSVRRT